MTFEVKSGKLTSLAPKSIPYTTKKKAKIDISDSFKILANIDYDSRKDRFSTKKLEIDLITVT